MEGRTLDVDGPVHVADFGGSGPLMLLVHGLGGSHVDWMGVGPALAEGGRVLAPDLIGHGDTPLGDRSASIDAHVKLLDRLIGILADGSATLVGNSMGGLVCILEAAASPDRVQGLVLVDPAIPPAPGEPLDPVTEQLFTAYDTPGVGESFLANVVQSIGLEAAFEQAMAYVCADPSRIPPHLLEAELAMARRRASDPSADRAFLESARSMLQVLWHQPEIYRSALSKVKAPTLVVEGGKDRLVLPSAIAVLAEARPDWEFQEMPACGHAPMLEDPSGFLDLVVPWLERNELMDNAPQPAVRRRDAS